MKQLSERFKTKRSVLLAIVFVTLSTNALSVFAGDKFAEAIIKPVFMKVETIARLPQPLQEQRVADLYRTFPDIKRLPKCDSWSPNTISQSEALSMSPEELFKRMDSCGLTPYVQNRALELLQNHRGTVDVLIAQDLKANDDTKVSRGLEVVGQLKAKGFFDQVTSVLEHTNSSEVRMSAAFTLRDLNDPRAIPTITKIALRYPNQLYLELLRDLQAGRPPSPALLSLAESSDVRARRLSAYALSMSCDPSLAPYIAKFAKDSDAQVRQSASYFRTSNK